MSACVSESRCGNSARRLAVACPGPAGPGRFRRRCGIHLLQIDCLTEALNKFEGGVLVITHNINLIAEVCNEIWVLNPETKSVDVFEGEFEEYRHELEEQVKEYADKAQIKLD